MGISTLGLKLTRKSKWDPNALAMEIVLLFTKPSISWWRHQMETFSALLALCAGIHRSPVNSPHKGQWRGALIFSLICARINRWVNNGETGNLRRHRAHYDAIVMWCKLFSVSLGLRVRILLAAWPTSACGMDRVVALIRSTQDHNL